MASLVKARIDKTIYKFEISAFIIESVQLGENLETIIKIKNEKNLIKKFGIWIYSKTFKKYKI